MTKEEKKEQKYLAMLRRADLQGSMEWVNKVPQICQEMRFEIDKYERRLEKAVTKFRAQMSWALDYANRYQLKARGEKAPKNKFSKNR